PHHEVLVLVGDAHVHLLGCELGRLLFGRLEIQLFATRESPALVEPPTVDEHLSGLEQPLRHTARADLRQGGEEAVEPLARRLVWNALLHACALASFVRAAASTHPYR